MKLFRALVAVLIVTGLSVPALALSVDRRGASVYLPIAGGQF